MLAQGAHPCRADLLQSCVRRGRAVVDQPLVRRGRCAEEAGAVPARHGPGTREDLEPVVGKAVGLVLTGDGLPTVCVSGDDAQLGPVQEIADRFGPLDTAVHFDGRAHFTEGRDQPLGAFTTTGPMDRVQLT
ncbi:hypothetical protein ACVW19_006678 [Streptomyces sp. TE5632]